MISKVKNAGNTTDIPTLLVSDYLRKETQNEREAAMKIATAILQRLELNRKGLEAELSKRPDGNWNSPGEQLDLMFLKVYKNHNTL